MKRLWSLIKPDPERIILFVFMTFLFTINTVETIPSSNVIWISSFGFPFRFLILTLSFASNHIKVLHFYVGLLMADFIFWYLITCVTLKVITEIIKAYRGYRIIDF